MKTLDDILKQGYKYKIEKGAFDRKSETLTVTVRLNFFMSDEEKEAVIKEMTETFKIEKIKLRLAYEEHILNKPPEEQKEEQESKMTYPLLGRKKPYVIVGNHIMGNGINGEAISIGSACEIKGKVITQGEIFKILSRDIKGGKTLVQLYLTDGKASTCGKFFFPRKDWKLMQEELHVGDVIKVAGEMGEDIYEHANAITIKKIDKQEKTGREDSAPQKRIELHAHTKMSAMDGLSDIDKMVATAAAWGHEAVAVTDHGVVQAFPAAKTAGKAHGIKIIYGMEGYVFDDIDCQNTDGSIDYKKKKTNHIILIAANKEGVKNLYRLVTLSHLNYFYKRPRLPKSIIAANRKGLIIGSACEAGELYSAIREQRSEDEIREIAEFYDYLEIQPLVNNAFMIEKGMVTDEEDLRNYNRKIVALGEELGKPVVATCDAHYCNPEDEIFRRILQAGQGYDDEGSKGLFMRTTEEMLEEFSYLGDEKAYEVVVTNPKKIYARIDKNFSPLVEKKSPPKIEDAEQILRDTCMKTAHQMYGEPLPEVIEDRLSRELTSIISNGYAVMYVAAKMLVDKSMSEGFLVGSRGSVGSSFAATMAGITEVNPLPPHYLCPKCKKLIWGNIKEYDCGVDMPERRCDCGEQMDRLGFSIPFETFLGFEGDKEPDIDLNFAGEYQASAQKYVEEIFGTENVFKAGTIGTIQSKTAFGFVKNYFEDRGIPANKYETERLTTGCTGVKKTTGQHPGGIIILPHGREIIEFCPVQHPANDADTGIVTTHFDYHAIDRSLLKLDILGHDAPSMIRHLQDMTGVDPLRVPLRDAKVDSLFTGIEALGIKDAMNYRYSHGSFGIPEFGTAFVRQMLDDTKPTRFGDLVRISGFSHGTNVWLNNAQDYIRSGKATMQNAISTRDDIMNYLILKGLENKDAFAIMEKVRKGKGVTASEIKKMKECRVPAWYIESCQKISYMFPRAHAVAYVMMAYRIAFFKVYYPVEFYAAYFTTKAENFDWEVVRNGAKHVLSKIDAIERKEKNINTKEQVDLTVLEVVYEMLSRGYEFMPPNLNTSKGSKFTVSDGKVLVPFCAFSGIGANAAEGMEEARDERPFETVDDIRERGGVNKSSIEIMRECGLFDDLPESDQLSMF